MPNSVNNKQFHKGQQTTLEFEFNTMNEYAYAKNMRTTIFHLMYSYYISRLKKVFGRSEFIASA